MLHSGAAWLLAGRRKIPITLVNSGLSLANQTGTATFSNLEYGAPAGAKRYVIVCVTAEEVTSGTINLTTVTWGGTGLSLIQEARRGTGSVACLAEIWGGFVTSGASGDLVIGLNKSASATENFDSIAVSTLVTNVLASGTPVDTAFETAQGFSSITADDLETALDGFVLGVIGTSAEDQAISSLSGNGANGALTELVDANIEIDHRHAVYLKDGTVAQTTEDFTSTSGGSPLAHCLTMASWL